MFSIGTMLGIFAFTQPIRTTIDPETGKEITGNTLKAIGFIATAIAFFAGTWFIHHAPKKD